MPDGPAQLAPRRNGFLFNREMLLRIAKRLEQIVVLVRSAGSDRFVTSSTSVSIEELSVINHIRSKWWRLIVSLVQVDSCQDPRHSGSLLGVRLGQERNKGAGCVYHGKKSKSDF